MLENRFVGLSMNEINECKAFIKISNAGTEKDRILCGNCKYFANGNEDADCCMLSSGLNSDISKYDFCSRFDIKGEKLKAEGFNDEDTRDLELEKLKDTLFIVVRNAQVLQRGLKLDKTMSEIGQMTIETIKEIEGMIDYKAIRAMRKKAEGLAKKRD